MGQDFEISFSCGALRRLCTEGIIASTSAEDAELVKDMIKMYLRANPGVDYVPLIRPRYNQFLLMCICRIEGRSVYVEDVELHSFPPSPFA